MDALVVIAVFAVMAWLFGEIVFGDSNLAGAVGGLFTGLRNHGWPSGVQEEDRDQRWGKARRQREAPPPAPAVVKVTPTVRVR